MGCTENRTTDLEVPTELLTAPKQPKAEEHQQHLFGPRGSPPPYHRADSASRVSAGSLIIQIMLYRCCGRSHHVLYEQVAVTSASPDELFSADMLLLAQLSKFSRMTDDQSARLSPLQAVT